MHVALIQCPAWSVDRPPYGISLLKSLLEGHGHTVDPFDLNVEMFQRAKSEKKSIRFMLTGKRENKFTQEAWSSWAIEWNWADVKDVKAYMQDNRRFIDDYIDRILATGARAIGFSVHHTSKHFSILMAEQIKRRDPSRVILFGGPQCFPTCDGSAMIQSNWAVDVVCLGEAEGLLGELLDEINEHGLTDTDRYERFIGYQVRLSNGHIVHRNNDRQPNWIQLDNLPFADWTWVDQDLYESHSIPVITSRGCIRRCRFCSEAGHSFTSWGGFRYRSAEKVMEEILHQHALYQFEFLWFTDSVFNGSIEMVDELMDRIIEADLGFRWDAQLTIRPDMTLELLEKFKRAGCNRLHWGVESGSDHVLHLMRKGYKRKTAIEVIARTHEVGISQNINIIVGFPGEEEEHFLETLDFLEQIMPLGISNPPVAPCDINPGSALWNMVDELDIDLGETYGHWFIRDRSNTYDIRMDRKDRMEQALAEMKEDYEAKLQLHNIERSA